jgi:hypothetical protein
MKLLGIYNELWKSEDFPTGWTTVIPILKPGKDPNELYVKGDGEERQQNTTKHY